MVTFDQMVYNFDADCSKYTLMHIPDHNIAVTLLNNQVNDFLKFLSKNIIFFTKVYSLDIQVRNETVKIKRDFSILINGAEKQKPVRAHHLKIEQKSQFGIEIELFGILITWVPIEENIRINVEPIFSDQTLGENREPYFDPYLKYQNSLRFVLSGLCGTFNWNQKDDFMTLEGDIELTANQFSRRFIEDGAVCPFENR